MDLDKKGKIVMIHSYKGGTGKSSITLNLAMNLSTKGNKVLVIEQDISGPTFQYVFPQLKVQNFWNDFYDNQKNISELIIDSGKGIDIVIAKEGSYEIPVTQNPKIFFNRQLDRLYRQKQLLIKQYDYILLDTHPGYSIELINSIIISDLAILLTRIDFDTVKKTIEMYEKLYAQFKQKKIIIVQNQVPKEVKGYTDIKLDLDIETTLKLWKEFTKDKNLINIPLENEIAYALFRSKLVGKDNLLNNYIEEIADLII